MSLHLGIYNYTILARHFSTCCIFFNKFVQCNSGRIPYWAIRLSSQWGSFEQITFNRKRVTNTEPDFSFKGAKIEGWDILIAYHKLLSMYITNAYAFVFICPKKERKICTYYLSSYFSGLSKITSCWWLKQHIFLMFMIFVPLLRI